MSDERTVGPADEGSIQEVHVLLKRTLVLAVLAGLLIAGCAGTERAERVEGPFQIAILATADTRGELEPCG
jgi:hypothetical protein